MQWKQEKKQTQHYAIQPRKNKYDMTRKDEKISIISKQHQKQEHQPTRPCDSTNQPIAMKIGRTQKPTKENMHGKQEENKYQ